MIMDTTYHNPVLLHPSVDGLNIRPNGVYVDVTFGGGGHSREILRRLGPQGKLFAFDQDPDAQANAIDDPRFVLIPENFRYIKRFLRFHGIRQVDGVLADLGVSSHQFDAAERGFSTRLEGVLDMRMNPKSALDARAVLNTYDEKALKQLFVQYGELKNGGLFAARIVQARALQPIETSEALRALVQQFIPVHKSNKVLAQLYQAIRIEVNQELAALEDFLLQMPDVLTTGGRLSVISYHSLEDRLVKRFMRNGMFEGEPERDMYGRFEVPFEAVGKMQVPDEAELATNSRARSAKLRVAVRTSSPYKA